MELFGGGNGHDLERQAAADVTIYKKMQAKTRRKQAFKIYSGRQVNVLDNDSDEDGFDEEDEQIDLLSRHLIIAHKRVKTATANRHHFPKEKIEARNFAIVLLQKIHPRIRRLKADFLAKAIWDIPDAITLIQEHVAAAEQDLELDVTELRESAYFDVFASVAEEDSDEEGSMVQNVHTQEANWYLGNKQNTHRSLQELLYAIDVHNTGKVEWNGFIQYCINATMQGRVGVEYDEIMKQYEPANLKRLRCLKGYRKLKWIPDISKLLLCNSTTGFGLAICDPRTWQISKHTYPVGGSSLLDATYIPDHNLVVTTSTDMKIRFFEFEKPHRSYDVEFDTSQVCITWSSKHKRLFTGSRNGGLTIWEMTKNYASLENRIRVPKRVDSTQPHTGPITDMLFLPVDGSLVTCSLDSTIVIQEPRHGNVVQRFTGHKAGILSMSYSNTHNYLITAGFELDPMLWLLSCASKPKSFVLHDANIPHGNSICGVQAIEDSHQVASLDVSGMLKIWDIRTFACMQTIQCAPKKKFNTKELVWYSLQHINTTHQLVTSANKRLFVYHYQYGTNIDVYSADDHGIRVVHYNQHNKTFVTAAGKNVRIWNALTGELQSLYDDITESEITAFTVDETGQKFFFGTHEGTVACCNYTNGVVIKSTPHAHASEVTGLIYVSARAFLISASWDGTIKITYDDKQFEPQIVNVDHPVDGKALDYSKDGNLVIVGDSSNTITVWDLSFYRSNSFKCLSTITLSPTSVLEPYEVQTVKILKGFTAFGCADSFGRAFICTVRPCAMPYTIVAVWINSTPEEKKAVYKGQNPAVGCLEFWPEKQLLFTGDELGYVKVYNVATLLSHYNLKRRDFSQASGRAKDEVQLNGASAFLSWDAQQHLTRTWKFHVDAIRYIQLLPHSDAIVSGSFDQSARIHSLVDGSCLGYLDQHGGSLEQYIFKVRDPQFVDFSQTDKNRINKRLKSYKQRRRTLLKDKVVRLTTVLKLTNSLDFSSSGNTPPSARDRAARVVALMGDDSSSTSTKDINSDDNTDADNDLSTESDDEGVNRGRAFPDIHTNSNINRQQQQQAAAVAAAVPDALPDDPVAIGAMGNNSATSNSNSNGGDNATSSTTDSHGATSSPTTTSGKNSLLEKRKRLLKAATRSIKTMKFKDVVKATVADKYDATDFDKVDAQQAWNQFVLSEFDSTYLVGSSLKAKDDNAPDEADQTDEQPDTVQHKWQQDKPKAVLQSELYSPFRATTPVVQPERYMSPLPRNSNPSGEGRRRSHLITDPNADWNDMNVASNTERLARFFLPELLGDRQNFKVYDKLDVLSRQAFKNVNDAREELPDTRPKTDKYIERKLWQKELNRLDKMKFTGTSSVPREIVHEEHNPHKDNVMYTQTCKGGFRCYSPFKITTEKTDQRKDRIAQREHLYKTSGLMPPSCVQRNQEGPTKRSTTHHPTSRQSSISSTSSRQAGLAKKSKKSAFRALTPSTPHSYAKLHALSTTANSVHNPSYTIDKNNQGHRSFTPKPQVTDDEFGDELQDFRRPATSCSNGTVHSIPTATVTQGVDPRFA